MGLPTARVQAELRCSAPGGRMAPQHYRASPTRAPPMGRPRPTSSWLSELTPRPPLCVCLCLFVGEKEGGSIRPDVASHSAAAMIHCGVVVRGRRRRAMACRSNRVCRSVRRTASKATQQVAGRKDNDGRERTRPTARWALRGRRRHTSTLFLRLPCPCSSMSLAVHGSSTHLGHVAQSGVERRTRTSHGRPAGSSEKSSRR